MEVTKPWWRHQGWLTTSSITVYVRLGSDITPSLILGSPRASGHSESLPGHQFPPHDDGRGRRPPLFDGVGYRHGGLRCVEVFLRRSGDEDGRRNWRRVGWVRIGAGLRQGLVVLWNWEQTSYRKYTKNHLFCQMYRVCTKWLNDTRTAFHQTSWEYYLGGLELIGQRSRFLKSMFLENTFSKIAPQIIEKKSKAYFGQKIVSHHMTSYDKRRCKEFTKKSEDDIMPWD